MATRAELIKQIRENATQINLISKQISTEETEDYAAQQFLKLQKEKFKLVTGASKGRGKYDLPTGHITTLKKAQLESIIEQQQFFLKSEFTSKEGRLKIFEKQLKTFQEARPESNLTEYDLREIQKFFINAPHIYHEIVEQGSYGSEQIVNLIAEQGYSSEEVLNALRDIDKSEIKNQIKRGSWKRFIKAVMDNPEKEIEDVAELYIKKS